MPIKLMHQMNNLCIAEFENVISFWNMLKYLVETPYLKHYIIENYEGGNTLVSRDAWEEEGVMFKEISPGTYFFPYDSVGFILDDSIHNINLIILDHYSQGFDYKNENDLMVSVKNTDNVIMTVPNNQVSKLIALYLLSYMKIGFDRNLMISLANLIESLSIDKIKQIEYVKSSFIIKLKGIDFIIKITSDDEMFSFYKINYYNNRCKKEFVKEDKVKSIGYLKKKIIKKNKYFTIGYYLLIAAVFTAILIYNKKIFFFLLIGLVLFLIITFIIKKNAYRFFSKEGK